MVSHELSRTVKMSISVVFYLAVFVVLATPAFHGQGKLSQKRWKTIESSNRNVSQSHRDPKCE